MLRWRVSRRILLIPAVFVPAAFALVVLVRLTTWREVNNRRVHAS